MEVIRLHHPYDQSILDGQAVVLAMGFFDGLHRGHRAVIKAAKIEAERRQLPLAVLTYNHHPSIVFEAHAAPLQYLTPLPRKLALLAELGVERTYVVDFTAAYAQQDPQTFVDNYIIGLHAQVAVAGFDHTYGKHDGQADMKHLAQYARGQFTVIEVPKVTVNGVESASRYARQLVDQGRMDEATTFLTMPYQTTGVIVHGQARGRQMGYPTANIETPLDERLPGIGVYVVAMQVAKRWYYGMASIGYNITFGEGRPKTVEIHLFDFSGNLYGETVTVKWLHYLRGEEKFAGMAELKAKLAIDEEVSRTYLAQIENQEVH